MKTFQEVDEFITRATSDDLWYDVDLFHAHEVFDSLSDAEWKLMADAIESRPPQWQMRTIEALSTSENPRILPILTKMVLSVNPDVAQTAAERIWFWGDRFTPDASILPALERIQAKPENVDEPDLEALIQRIKFS